MANIITISLALTTNNSDDKLAFDLATWKRKMYGDLDTENGEPTSDSRACIFILYSAISLSCNSLSSCFSCSARSLCSRNCAICFSLSPIASSRLLSAPSLLQWCACIAVKRALAMSTWLSFSFSRSSRFSIWTHNRSPVTVLLSFLFLSG